MFRVRRSVVFVVMFARVRARVSLGVARPTFERYEGRVADRESLPCSISRRSSNGRFPRVYRRVPKMTDFLLH